MMGMRSPEPKDQFVRPLIEDVIHSQSRVEQAPSAEARRTYVRTLVSAIEGMAWYYRDEIIAIAIDLDVLTKSERYALERYSYSIGDSGRVQRQRKDTTALGMIRFTARIHDRICPEHKHDFGVHYWEQIQYIIGIRNGITHPKSASDLDVSALDIAETHMAFEWLFATIVNDLEHATQALREDVTVLRDVLDRLRRSEPEMVHAYKVALQNQPD